MEVTCEKCKVCSEPGDEILEGWEYVEGYYGAVQGESVKYSGYWLCPKCNRPENL